MSNRKVWIKNTTGSEITLMGWIIPGGDYLDASNISLSSLREDDLLESLLVSGDLLVSDGTFDYPDPWGAEYLDNDLTRNPKFFGDFDIINPNGGSPTINVVSTDTNADLTILPQGNGTVNVSGTTDYEDLVLDDDDIPNKKYVDDLPKWLTFNGDTGNTTADTSSDTLTITGGTGISTAISGDTVTITNDDPNVDQNLFQTIAVSGQSDVVADSPTDTLTLVAGSGIVLTTDAGTDTITIASNAAAQDLYETFTGDTGSTTANTPTDSMAVVGGTGISTSVSGDTLTITNDSPNVDQNLFQTIAVSGQSDVVADSPTDTLTLVAGTGVTITTNATTDSITINSTASSPNLWETFVADTGSTSANIATDTFTIGGGAKMSTSISGDTLTINTTAISDVVEDLTPQLGGNLDILGNNINTSVTNGNILLLPNGTGTISVTGTVDYELNVTDDDDLPNKKYVDDLPKWLTIDGDTGSTTADTSSDTLTVAGGTSISTSISGDTLTVTNDAPNVDQNLFQTIAVSGQSNVVADTTTDTLTLVEGPGIEITTNAGADSVTINNLVTTLDDLTDVIAPTPDTNNLLGFNGSHWVDVPAPPSPPTGSTASVQIVFGPIPAMIGTASIPLVNNTPPAVTVGAQIWTRQLDIQDAASIIRVATDVVLCSSNNSMEFALVIYRTIGAVSTAVGATIMTTGNNANGHGLSFVIYDTPGVTGDITYQCRVGKAGGPGTWYLNTRVSYSNLWGGLLAQNAYSIEEVGVVS